MVCGQIRTHEGWRLLIGNFCDVKIRRVFGPSIPRCRPNGCVKEIFCVRPSRSFFQRPIKESTVRAQFIRLQVFHGIMAINFEDSNDISFVWFSLVRLSVNEEPEFQRPAAQLQPTGVRNTSSPSCVLCEW